MTVILEKAKKCIKRNHFPKIMMLIASGEHMWWLFRILNFLFHFFSYFSVFHSLCDFCKNLKKNLKQKKLLMTHLYNFILPQFSCLSSTSQKILPYFLVKDAGGTRCWFTKLRWSLCRLWRNRHRPSFHRGQNQQPFWLDHVQRDRRCSSHVIFCYKINFLILLISIVWDPWPSIFLWNNSFLAKIFNRIKNPVSRLNSTHKID